MHIAWVVPPSERARLPLLPAPMDKKDIVTPDWAIHLRASMAQGAAHGLGATVVAGAGALGILSGSPFLAKRIGAHTPGARLTIAAFAGLGVGSIVSMVSTRRIANQFTGSYDRQPTQYKNKLPTEAQQQQKQQQ